MNSFGKKYLKVLMVSILALLLWLPPSCKKSQEESTVKPALPSQQKESKSTETTEQQAQSGSETAEPAKPQVESSGVKMVPLAIKLPKPLFVGTPTDIRIDNLEKPLGKARPPFMAPEETTNVALDKPVTSSDDMPIIGDLEQTTDGDKEGVDGSWVELGPGPQWVQIDLQAEYHIYALLIWHYHRQAQVYKDVVIQAADDADFITNVRTLFNNDIDNSAGLGIGKDKHYVETSEGKLIDAQGIKARYLRLYSNGNTSNDQNHYTEVEVYGKPAE